MPAPLARSFPTTFPPQQNTFYDRREFIIRDPNRFWITFGEPIKP
jgi:hypothetical protein